MADASRKLAALDTQILNLEPDDNHAAANDALIVLSGHPCMALARVGAETLRAEAAPALEDFWNAGGRHWIEGYLRGYSLGYPPPMRKVVSDTTRPGHPMISLLCPLKDENCGRETAGWWQRADAYFLLTALPILRLERPDDEDPTWQIPPVTERTCRDEAVAAPDTERFAIWQRCVGEIRKMGFVMPLGRIMAPTSGWLVLRGRRGHYGFCDEVRLYSLATGDAYISQSCGQLRMDLDANARPEPKRQIARGAMSVDNLREAAWMLLHLEETVEDYVSRDVFAVPAGITPILGTDDRDPHARKMKYRVVSSDQTRLAWTLVDATGKPLVSGRLVWPKDYAGGPNDHAVNLLQIAEAGFTSGCPTEKPPQQIGFGDSRPVVSSLDASPAELSRVERELVGDLQQAAHTECRDRR